MDTTQLPALNATLNAISALLLVTGYICIKQGRRTAHIRCMVSAVVVSALFLISYLTYHKLHGSTKFQGEGLARTIYFTILISHTILATAIVPLVLMTLYRAWKLQFDRHKRIARITFPLWVYVSVTGVVVYWMLYQMNF